ncbi:MAG: hypothetical protein ACK4GO_09735 [Gemmobacter sp.]
MLAASLFLVAHEMLQTAVKSRLRDFYLIGFDERGIKYSPAYEEKVLSLDPKGRKDVWRASLVWLEQVSAIDQKDKDQIKECTDARNIFAHELNEIISGRKNPDFERLFPILVDLIVKIDKWWVVNVEFETDPDFDAARIDVAQIVPGSQLMLSIIHQAAIGDIAAAQELYEAFVLEATSQQA